MLPPIQNQELVQRSGTMSELRSAEQGKIFSDIAKSVHDVHKLERLKETTVQQNDDSQALDPDGGSGKREGEQQEKNEQKESEAHSTVPAHPLHLDGGDIVDVTA